MIGQVTIGKSFGGVVRYVMEKEGAEVLEQEGVRAIDPVLATQDFNAIRVQRPKLKNAVWHTSLSFAYQDDLSTKQVIQIGKDYLENIGLNQNQYLMVRHHDTQHHHIHIISNRVGFDGEVVSDNWCKNRTAQVCDQLEKKYGLTVARNQGKGRQQGNDKVPLKKKVKSEIRNAVTASLRQKLSSFNQLTKDLKQQGIEVIFQTQKTGRTNGITFRHKGLTVKGSAIDRSFSFGRLVKELSQNAKQNQQQDHDKRREN